jgi:hypothetical protein
MGTNDHGATRTRRRKALTVASGACLLLGCVATPAVAADGRAYEQVSLRDKPAANPVQSPGSEGAPITWSSAGGDTVAWTGFAGAGASDAQRGLPNPVLATRTPTGWVQRQAFQGPRPGTPYALAQAEFQQMKPSADLSRYAFVSNLQFSAQQPFGATLPEGGGLFRADGGGADWLSSPAGTGTTKWPDGSFAKNNVELVGGSDDLRTTYYTGRQALTPEDAEAGRGNDASWALYRNVDGATTPAGRLPDGTVDSGGSIAAGQVPNNGNGAHGAVVQSAHSVSQDGRSVLFVSPDPASAAAQDRAPQLYRSVDGAPATRLSTVGGAPPTDTATGVLWVSPKSNYALATPDHRFVFFASTDVLAAGVAPADGDAQKTYRLDTRTGGVEYLEDLTIPSSGNGLPIPGVVAAVSDDGRDVVYVKDATLRIWREGRGVHDISAPGAGDFVDASSASSPKFSPDGGSIAIVANQPLEAPGSAFPDQAALNIYRYDVDDETLRCVSCGTAEAPQPGARPDFNNQSSRVEDRTLQTARAFTDDSRSLFFTTSARLSSADTNDVPDVYEDVDGATRLISSGRAGSKGSFYADNSADGRDVFFSTDEGLVAGDNDEAYDMYDARVGGGGFVTPAPPAGCAGDGCQPPPSDPGPSPQAGSTSTGPVTQGKGAVPPAPALSVGRLRSSGSAVSLTVRVPGAGRLSLSGSRIGAASRAVTRPATYTLKSRLTVSARRTLSRRGRLTVTARLRFTPKSGSAVSRSVKLTIKRAKR